MNTKKKNAKIVIFSKKNEQNISKTRNFLLKQIKSPYFTFFDSDDYAEKNYIEELYNLIAIYKADISLCGKCRHNENKTVNLEKENQKYNKIYFLNKQECIAEMISSKMFNGTVYAKLFKSSLLDGETFDPEIHYGEDLDFCYKLIKKSNSFVLTEKKIISLHYSKK